MARETVIQDREPTLHETWALLDDPTLHSLKWNEIIVRPTLFLQNPPTLAQPFSAQLPADTNESTHVGLFIHLPQSANLESSITSDEHIEIGTFSTPRKFKT